MPVEPLSVFVKSSRDKSDNIIKLICDLNAESTAKVQQMDAQLQESYAKSDKLENDLDTALEQSEDSDVISLLA